MAITSENLALIQAIVNAANELQSRLMQTGDNAQNPSMSAIIGFLLCRKYLQLKRNPTKEQMQTIDRKVFSVLFPEIG
ncbi:MAG: hypothetical protein WBQ39_09670 [Terriglobales bacterium]